MSAALKLGEEDAAAVARLREELQKAWASLKASQDKVRKPEHAVTEGHHAIIPTSFGLSHHPRQMHLRPAMQGARSAAY